MPTFHVAWEIEVDCEDHRAAASRALAIQRNPLSIATVFSVTQLHGDDNAAYQVDLGGDCPVDPSLLLEEARVLLRHDGWHAVADDLAEHPPHVVLARLAQLGPDMAAAAAIVCRVHEDHHPAISERQREAAAVGFATQLYVHDSYCEARNFDLGQHHGPDLHETLRVVCPGTERHRGDVVGCYSVFEATPDEEGLVDCPTCGIWFSAADNLAHSRP
jgi:hypothetical protein